MHLELMVINDGGAAARILVEPQPPQLAAEGVGRFFGSQLTYGPKHVLSGHLPPTLVELYALGQIECPDQSVG